MSGVLRRRTHLFWTRSAFTWYKPVSAKGITNKQMSYQPEIPFPVTKEEQCMMCHFSTECEGCCQACKESCNTKQICSLPDDPVESIPRLQAWRHIVRDCPAFDNIKRFII
jgi:hypothetical protein